MGKSRVAEQGVTGGVTSGFIVLCGKGAGSVQGPLFGLPWSWEFCSLVITWHVRAVGLDPKALFGAPPGSTPGALGCPQCHLRAHFVGEGGVPLEGLRLA